MDTVTDHWCCDFVKFRIESRI